MVLKLPRYLPVLIRTIILLLSLYVIYFLFAKTIVFLAPFIIAGMIAYMMDPLVNLLEHRGRLKRGYAVAIVLLLVLIILGLLLTLLISSVVMELIQLTVYLPQYRDFAIQLTSNATAFIQQYIVHLPPEMIARLQASAYQILGRFTENVPKYVTSVLNLITSLPNALVFLIVVVLSTFFLSRDKILVRDAALGIISRDLAGQASRVRTDLGGAFLGWIKTQLIMMSLTSIIVMTGLWVLKIQYVVLIGLLIGFVDALPVLGTGSVMIPWIIWNVLMGHYWLGAGLGIVYLITLVTRQLLEPRILSHNIGLHPLVTLLAIYLGLQFFGVLGVALGPITAVALKALFSAGFVDYWFRG